jgi:serine/threonine-protein kinase
VSLVQGDVVHRAEAKVGILLHGKYRLEKLLGVGGMAAVYEATHRNSKRFAVKLLHPELSMQNDVRTRFLREGYAATQVNHPGAVSVLDDDVAEDGSAFLVMELLKGTTMDSLWERYEWQMPVAPVLAIAYQLLDVLAAAHSRGIIHRDIKPENLFLTTEGQVKVLDFGIARLQEASNAALTGTGFVMGTPSFMAPEQALGRSSQVDAQSDVWSTGASLFTLLSGHYVHEGESPQAIVVQCATQPARSLDEVLPDAPAEIVKLVDAALAFKKTARWQTALAMQKAVEAAGRAMGIDVTSHEVLARLLTDAPPAERTSIVPDHVTIARGKAPEPGTPVTSRRSRTDLNAAASAGTLAEAGAELDESREPREPLEPRERREPPKRIGLTTEQPVARDSPVPVGALGWLTRHKAIGAAAAAGAVVVLGLAVTRGRGTGVDAKASGVPAHEVSSLGAPATAVSPPSAVATTTIDLSSLPSVPASSEPQAAAAAAAAPADSHHTVAPHRAPAAGATPAAPASAAPAAHAQNDTNCNPPFTIDPVSGKKKWKAECL